MRRKAAHLKHEAKKAGGEVDSLDTVLFIRLIISSVVFTVSLIIKLPALASIALLICAAAFSGYDVLFNAIESIKKGNIFDTPVIVFIIAVIAFCIGFAAEGAALLLLYQIGLMLIAYAGERTKKSALELLRYQDEETVRRLSDMLEDDNIGEMQLAQSIEQSAGSVLKLAMVLAITYAIAYPLISGGSFIVSIHRATTIILIATPMSVVVSMPYAAIIGLCYSAQQGIVFNNADIMEKTAASKIFVFDNNGVFSEKEARVISVNSNMMSEDTFMRFASHAVYYSEQPFAKAISNSSELEYQLDVIGEFSDIPGLGVDVTLGGTAVTLGLRELFTTRGITIPGEDEDVGQTYYMTVSGRPVGHIVLSMDINEETVDIVPELKQLGVKRCVLLTESGKMSSKNTADELGFAEVISECNTAKKIKFLKDLSAGKKSRITFVYSNGIDGHSDADVDMRVGRKGKYADVLIDEDYISNIPFALQVCDRVKEICTANALFSFIIKAVLIFMSMIGFCNLWFAIFIDMVAACATILNTIRVTKESIVSILKYKMG